MPVMRTAPPGRERGCRRGVSRASLSGAGGRVLSSVSPEHVLSLLDAAVDHRLDGLLHQPDFLLDDGVVVVGVAGEAHRLAEVQMRYFVGKGKLPAREEQLRDDRERRACGELGERLEVRDR